MANTRFDTGGKIGVDIASNSSTQLFPLGERVTANDGEYIYVKATTALTQYDIVAINSSFEAAPATSALAKLGIVGVAQTGLTVNYYGFVKVDGVSTVRCLASVAKGAPLFVYASSAGRVNDLTANGVRIDGLLTIATTTSAAASLSCILRRPFART